MLPQSRLRLIIVEIYLLTARPTVGVCVCAFRINCHSLVVVAIRSLYVCWLVGWLSPIEGE